MDMSYQYTKKRNAFGRQPMFSERGPEIIDNITVNAKIQKNFVLRNPVHIAMQHTPKFSEKTVNTVRPEFTTAGVNHTEGGWGKDINLADPEQTQRYRRKIEKDEGYQHCVSTMTPGMEHYIRQNNAINLYESYYKTFMPHPEIEKHFCRTVNIFKDPLGKRPVSSISWQSDGGYRFAIAYVDINLLLASKGSEQCFIWNVEVPIRPEIGFIPPCSMCDLQFNPRDGNVLCGGLVNGEVCAFDKRTSLFHIARCGPHVKHRDIVKKVIFINSKSGQEFFSGSTDGSCKWWDLRNLSEPTDEMIIDVVKNSSDIQRMENAYGISVLEYEPTIPSRFMVGTENGYVVPGNRKGKTPLEKLPSKNKAHNGPVLALERNPFFMKNFLTAGDWTVRIWSEDCKEAAIMFTRPFRHKITHAAWSPTRTSVFTICQQNGIFSCWDMVKKQHEQIFLMQVCSEALVISKPHESGGIIACGSEKGNTYLIELSPSLQLSEKNERNLFASELEKESKRERILEARLREHRLKLRQAEEGSQSDVEVLTLAGDRDLTEAANDYFQAIKRELQAF